MLIKYINSSHKHHFHNVEYLKLDISNLKTEDNILIEVKNLTKRYGSFTAVKGLNLKIEKGHIYGLLGPNGAGKSTTMNIMTGCLAATEGTVTVNGYDIYEDAQKAKKCIGYLPEIPPLYADMTPYEYLKFVGSAKKIEKDRLSDEIDRVIKKCGLENVSDRLIKNLSKGYKQRVGIAQALIGDPQVIILDEPTVGLDPIQLVEIRNLIRSLKDDHDVILSSHIMGEITAVCDYIIIMAYGRIVASGTLEELENSQKTGLITIESKVPGSLADKLRAEICSIDGVSSCSMSQKDGHAFFKVQTRKGSDVREALSGAFSGLGLPILEMTKEGAGLENLFIRLTSGPAPADDEEKPAKPEKKKQTFKASPLGSAYLDNDDKITIQNKKESDAHSAESKEEAYKPLFTDEEGDDK